MKIYTKTGDTGETSLYGGERRSKGALRIESYGTVDELQAALGVVLAEWKGAKDKDIATLIILLEAIQADCFVVCAELARTTTNTLRKDPVLPTERLNALEASIDHYDAELPQLRAFIMQGGSRSGALLHLARAICRRAERCMVRLQEEEEVRPFLLQYMNRLSDLLFVLARYVNHKEGIPETQWVSN